MLSCLVARLAEPRAPRAGWRQLHFSLASQAARALPEIGYQSIRNLAGIVAVSIEITQQHALLVD